MALLSRLLRSSARAPGRIIDLELATPIPRTAWERFQEEATAGPMALGAERLFWSKADSVPLDMGMIGALGAGGAGVGAAVAGRAEQMRDARELGAGDLIQEMEALERMRADLERRRRLRAAHEDGYMTGLEIESDRLADDVRFMNDGSRHEAAYLRRRGY